MEVTVNYPLYKELIKEFDNEVERLKGKLIEYLTFSKNGVKYEPVLSDGNIIKG